MIARWGYIGYGDRPTEPWLTGRLTGLTVMRVHGQAYRVRYFKVGPWVLLYANQRHRLAAMPDDHPDAS